MVRISTNFLIPDTPARPLRPGGCTRDWEIGFVPEIMSSEERTGKYQQNSGRIRPKANGIRVNFIVGVTTLTFNDPDFKKRESCWPLILLSFHVNEFLQHFIAGSDDLCVGLICPLNDYHFYKFSSQVDV